MLYPPKGINYLLPTIFDPMNQQDMLYPPTLHGLARYALPTNIAWTSKICFTHEHCPPWFKIILQYMVSFVKLVPKFTVGFKPGVYKHHHIFASLLQQLQGRILEFKLRGAWDCIWGRGSGGPPWGPQWVHGETLVGAQGSSPRKLPSFRDFTCISIITCFPRVQISMILDGVKLIISTIWKFLDWNRSLPIKVTICTKCIVWFFFFIFPRMQKNMAFFIIYFFFER
jgi:hypothetical protein